MPNLHEHLDLPTKDEVYERKIHGGGGYKPKENITDFAKKQIKKLDNIGKEFAKPSNQFQGYAQELVFKVKTSQKVNEEEFRDRLKAADCETIISTSGKHAEWVVSTQDTKFTKLKDRIKIRSKKDTANFVDGIEEFKEMTLQDKTGSRLRKEPLGSIEKARIVVSLSRKESDQTEEKINAALELIMKLADENDLKTYDKLLTKNICLVLLDCTANFAKTISKIDIVEKIDRPPKFTLEKIINKPIEDLGSITPPNKNDHGILIMDSGIILHPLLEGAVNQNDGLVGLSDRNKKDDRRHGTMVSGIALYGDIEERITKQDFSANVWIYSSKVFYESSNEVIGNEKLIGTRIKEGLKEIKEKFPKCRVVNMSFGSNDETMQEGKGQLELAVLLDDLSVEYPDTIFVTSTGNISREQIENAQYPDYLLSDEASYKILDPASSIYAISVGATQRFGNLENQPSNITRTGPGINGMIKPDFVEDGGGFGEEIPVLNPDYKQRLFTFNYGTSFSAPRISHYLAKLLNKFPSYDRNLIKALLISSAKLPEITPDVFPEINSQMDSSQWSKITSVYGFGKPNLEYALHSDDDRVVMKYSGKIRMNQAKYFTIELPDDFVQEKGKREISISLVYHPPVRKTRADYFGVRMEFHLFKNQTLDNVQKKYNLLDSENTKEGKVPKKLASSEIILKPGTILRKKSNHQKGTRILHTSSKLDNLHPLVLVVLSQKRWKFDDDFEQDFAVVVTLKHQKSIDLYTKIRIKNQTRVRV